MNTLKGKINKKEIDHIPFGPFKIRIPFIHYRFEWPDYFQGLLMCAVDLAAIPLIMELLGMPFEAAMAIVILNGILYLAHHLLGDPSVPGWITPEIPLIMIYVQDFDMGPDRVKALMAFQLMLGTLSIFLGVTKLAKKVVSLIPSSIKSGIIMACCTYEEKVGVAIGVTDKLIEKYDAVELVKQAAEILGGKGGGGRKDFAQAGGVNKDKIEEAFEALSKKIN